MVTPGAMQECQVEDIDGKSVLPDKMPTCTWQKHMSGGSAAALQCAFVCTRGRLAVLAVLHVVYGPAGAICTPAVCSL